MQDWESGKFSPWRGDRNSAAWKKLTEILTDRKPHDYAELIPAMAKAGPIKYKSAGNMLREAAAAGALVQTGKYDRATKKGRVVVWAENVENKWFVPPPPKKKTGRARLNELLEIRKTRLLTPFENEERQRIADKLYVESDPIEKKWDQGG